MGLARIESRGADASCAVMLVLASDAMRCTVVAPMASRREGPGQVRILEVVARIPGVAPEAAVAYSMHRTP